MQVYTIIGQTRRKKIPLIPQGEWQDAQWKIGVNGDVRDAVRVVEEEVKDRDLRIFAVTLESTVDITAKVDQAD